jgi:CHAT domain-containing protein
MHERTNIQLSQADRGELEAVVANRNSPQKHVWRAKIVVLSACNTAAGDKSGAEGLSGVARAFFYAGARALLVSHWPVESDAAVKIYHRRFRNSRNIRRSGAQRRCAAPPER